ncbi:hypothetical protein [Myceligenerans crystallogenes]|uniref:Uncharacterized protein n=1 Tax=Myceligenerans crystallogenes TaxID=316335 RepID=A0ABN2NHV9_9MICO
MGTTSARLVASLALAAALLAAPVPASATHPDRLQPFQAEHTGVCGVVSATEGTLHWYATHSPEPSAVGVEGYVKLSDPGICAFLVAPTAVAVFTAYSGERVVDRELVSTTSSGKVSLTLTPDSPWYPSPQIDRVEVTACIGAARWDDGVTPSECGKPVSYP